MRLSTVVILMSTFVVAGALAFVSAFFAAGWIERASQRAVLSELIRDGMDWAEVDTDGLQVYLFGTAPDEAARFSALTIAAGVVDTARLIDQMLVVDAPVIAPPRFSVELLRNDAGLSIIGLIPADTDREALVRRLRNAADTEMVSDFLETADHPAPEAWGDALRLAQRALEELPRSKISVDEDRVAVKAMAESEAQRSQVESTLARAAPEGLQLVLDLAAPRPVIAPFSLRYVQDDRGARFDVCAADSEATRDAILAAAGDIGLADKTECAIGLGVPTPSWGDAAVAGINAVAALGGGTLTMTNTDIRVAALPGTNQTTFDLAIGEFEAALPAIFALASDLPPAPVENDAEGEAVIREFVATLSPEGEVQLRGRLPNERSRVTMDSFAKAKFGVRAVHTAARVDPDLPRDWPVRAIAGLEALSILANGVVIVTPDEITVSGRTGREDARAAISSILLAKLGDGVQYDVDVTYDERLDPLKAIPTPEQCAASISSIIGDRKITFEPGSATLDGPTEDILDELAELLIICGAIPIEISGHTDSQGREVMNQSLSQDRAQAVLDGLRERRVPVRAYSVVGYGETRPIADNGTEEGREANRRIEFRLITPEPPEGQGAETDTAAADQAVDDTAGSPENTAGSDTAASDGGDDPDEPTDDTAEGTENE